jgi:hypothetical protein
MVMTETAGTDEETTPTTAEVVDGLTTAEVVGYGTMTLELMDGLAVATTGTEVWVTTVERAGQLVTEAAHEVTVTAKVE